MQIILRQVTILGMIIITIEDKATCRRPWGYTSVHCVDKFWRILLYVTDDAKLYVTKSLVKYREMIEFSSHRAKQ